MSETADRPCPDCGGHGGTCILIHDGSRHGREHCKHAQWRDCVRCDGTGVLRADSETVYYLHVHHDGSLGPAGDEAIGPFENQVQARRFRQTWGPSLATVTSIIPANTTIYSPEAAMKFQAGRM